MSGEMICCNVGSTPTFQTSMGSAILDLTLASVKVAATIGGWKVHEHVITSDHRLITFEYVDTDEGEIVKTRSKRFNVRKADWNKFRQRLAENQHADQTKVNGEHSPGNLVTLPVGVYHLAVA
ncbi:Endo/exonuclease/phosphatase domain-containing protein [Aphis craccivora]|uniref:Endo/exonuclease/phosphatase domain-containing protein n=1 Tax=Aphis craccivora TaxID=307492 RepID=A0A6G0X1E6_APHCR|nr:Endo/exonuclease/phosphatase domain-containing protein [Aphis craccivora]